VGLAVMVLCVTVTPSPGSDSCHSCWCTRGAPAAQSPAGCVGLSAHCVSMRRAAAVAPRATASARTSSAAAGTLQCPWGWGPGCIEQLQWRTPYYYWHAQGNCQCCPLVPIRGPVPASPAGARGSVRQNGIPQYSTPSPSADTPFTKYSTPLTNYSTRVTSTVPGASSAASLSPCWGPGPRAECGPVCGAGGGGGGVPGGRIVVYGVGRYGNTTVCPLPGIHHTLECFGS